MAGNRLKEALKVARYRRAEHARSEWITYPEGSCQRSVLEDAVTIPVHHLDLLIKAVGDVLIEPPLFPVEAQKKGDIRAMFADIDKD